MEDSRLSDIESYKGRILAFLNLDGVTDLKNLRVLVPGSALGGECFAALELGAREVVGLEITRELVLESNNYAVSKEIKNVRFQIFDGTKFPDYNYDLVLSGHVIEHSPDWRVHLEECIAATRPVGKIYLEFPSRFHYKELHTGLISFEWLPKLLRKLLNLSLARMFELMGMRDKSRARHAIQSTLQQVSELQIKRYIQNKYGGSILVRASSNPAPGIVRLIIY